MLSSLTRVLTVPLVLLTLLLSGCGSSSDGSDPGAASSESASAEPEDEDSPTEEAEEPEEPEEPEEVATRTVTVDGLSFAVPKGYTAIDARDLVEGAEGKGAFDDVSDRLGLSEKQFLSVMRGVDLFLFSDQGAHQGFLDNINVIEASGRMPNDAQLKYQILQLGAEIEDVSRVDTRAGEVAVISYTLEMNGPEVAGRAVLVPTDGSVVTVTVSSTDADLADELADRILDTVASSGVS